MDSASCTTLIISNKKINDIMKIIKSLEKFGLLMKSISETIKNEAKKQTKKRFLGTLLDTLCAILFGNLLTGKDTVRVGEGTVRADENF